MITLSSNGYSVNIDHPEFGYRVDINMLIRSTRTSSGWRMFDAGAQYDARICSIPKFLLDKTQSAVLNDFLDHAIKGRGNNITVDLGSNSGFYLFGPDKGDSGEFVCQFIDRKHSGILFDPWLYTASEFQLHMVSAPSYTMPDQVSEGNFGIGYVPGLKWPQAGIKNNAEYGLKSTSGYGATVGSVDANNSTYEAEFQVDCNTGNAAALIDYLAVNGRTFDIDIYSPENMYLFDMVNGSNKTFTTKLLNNTISITHNNHDQFSIPLRFWMAA